ncbi:hypothetical protein 7908G4C8_20 [Haloquadratum phage sp.]|nr:hypothetical protein 7908G4C8_20 [Haloquadratum phage sp.]
MPGISRRGLLAGTAILGTTSVSIALITDKASATASIDSGEFTIADTSADLTGENLKDIVINSNINYSFDSNVSIDGLEVSVAVGIDERSAQIIASESTTPNQKQIDTSTTISGSLFDASDYSIDALQIDDGKKTVRITAVAELIIKRDDSIVATDKLTDTFEITITKDEVRINGQFSGTGTVSMETEPA